MKKLSVLLLVAALSCRDNPIEPKTITVSPQSANLYLGQTQQFTCTPADCTWPAKAPNGLYTATRTGLDTVTACRMDSPTTCASALITVVSGVNTPAISPATALAQIGDSIRFMVTTSCATGVDCSYTLRTTIGTITPDGWLKNLTSAGNGTVTVVMNRDTVKTASAAVTITTHDLIAFWRMEDTLTKSRCYGAPCQEIYTMRADGSDTTRITTTPWFQDLEPSWSPDGKRIAFVRSQQYSNEAIFIVNKDGSGLRNLTQTMTDAQNPSWSPDGKRIAFAYASGFGSNLGIALIDTSGLNMRALTAEPCCRSDGNPSWSPDGHWITYSGHDGQVWKIDTTGANPTSLTQPPGLSMEPVWLLDGSSLIFSSNRTGIWQLYVMNPDGTNVRQITHELVGAIDPTVSRDGQELNYTCMGTEIIQFPDNGGTTVNWDICSIKIDGTGRTNLTQTPNLVERWPARQP